MTPRWINLTGIGCSAAYSVGFPDEQGAEHCGLHGGWFCLRFGDEFLPSLAFGEEGHMRMKLLGIVLVLSCCAPSGLTADFKSTLDEAFLICSSAAKAAWEYTKKPDWEYTKWGMTPQQVVSASKNLATESSDFLPDSDGNVTKLVAPYQSGKFSFEAQFGFDAADRLASVTLVLTDRSAGMDMGADTNMDHGVCDDLLVGVNTAYGPPQGGGSVHMQYSIETWQDQKNKNNVTYTVLDGVGCYVQYSAIKSTAAD
jgi:hypothetical protein